MIDETHRLHDAERTRCEVWTRVMGYHRPVTAFNPGKRSEYRERRPFQEHLARLDEGVTGDDRERRAAAG